MSTRNEATAGVALLGLALCVAIGAAAAAENDPGISVTTHVDKISVKQSGATPMITVTAQGNQYDTVAADKFSMHYDASVTCKGLWDIHYFEVALSNSQSWYDVKGDNFQHKAIGSYTDLLDSWGVDSGKKSRAVGGRTLIGPMKSQLRDAAINACNAEVKSSADKNGISVLKAMATARQLPLPKTGWVRDNLQLQAWTSCGMPQDQITWLSVFDGPPDITVRCEARPYSEGVDTGNMPGQLSSKFQVTQLTLSANPTQYQGSCPKEVVLTGTITANKAGSVDYQWKSGNTISAPSTLTFSKAESRQVTRKIDVDHSWARTMTLVTDGPGERVSNAVDVNISCVVGGGPGNLAPRPKPPIPPVGPLPPPPQPQAKPDLVPGATLHVGNNSAQWGHTLTVNASKSNLPKQGNACGLAFNYDLRNVGAGNAGAFKSRLAVSGNPAHQGNVVSLAAGATRNIAGVLFLPNGDYQVGVFVDHQMQVGESNEGNNTAPITLKVRNCQP
ncbi:MAG: hypothetical protein A3E01_00480 [Gammaproteobacteria bacterium RIFCSPHIGHO2_12_FULL_63_22]|nr:MAG: hypothetical protein A3E01_00480 [Gammaproteobacteria bacterium RIFCSPHIGHO2_12_FULL_63_22]